MVDLYPLALHVNVCDSSGRPGGRERLALTSHHVHVRDMLVELLDSSRLHGLRRGLSVAAPPCAEQVRMEVRYGVHIIHTVVRCVMCRWRS